MRDAGRIVENICARFPLPCEFVVHDGTLWLTLYVAGTAKAFGAAVAELTPLGWANFDDASDIGGFAYPKKLVPNLARDAVEAILAVLAVCDRTGLELVAVDADTSDDEDQSNFTTLWTSQAGPGPAAMMR